MVDHRRFKDAIYEQFARIGKAFASPTRLELLDILSQAPRTVERLASYSDQSIANVSQHLQILRAARGVDASGRAQAQPRAPSEGARHRRLLSRSLLHSRGRGGQDLASARVSRL